MSELGEVIPCWTLVIRRRSKHPPKRLWRAITEIDEVCAWMGVSAGNIDLKVGGEYRLDLGTDGPPGGLPGVIVRVDAEKVLAYVWNYSVIEWRIEPDGEGSRYSFADHGNETLDGSGILAGWHGWVDSLAEYLDDVGEGGASAATYESGYRRTLDSLF